RSMLEDPESTPDKVLILDVSKDLSNLFSPSKLEILKTLREKKINSVGELAKELKRPIESVSKDLKILNAYGILELVQNDQQKIPRLEKEFLVMAI
ncbi:MAG: ArsR family transcriptional regulator, partial [Candidatus Aenigmarchaeota archaeon]|nr:ArsR family transcriptional regulator [Candidatus Aenigmarchaeota archaeon]